ncbi:MAG: rod shape-determining protein MreC [Ignavibacteria bacterium]|jgi:rod shape-determining protein MreC|nr:rod shape-determining protein MreC [Ignavibacteria bacterium]
MYKLFKLFNDFKDYFVLVILIIISLLLISENTSSNIGGFRSIIIGSIGNIQNLFSWIPNSQALKNENRTLVDLNVVLSNEVAVMRKALQENTELRNMLQLKSNSQYDLIACDVTSKNSIQMRNYATLNKGESDGIKIGMAVCSDAGLVGSIIGVNKYMSMVELLNNRNVKVSAKLSKSQIEGVINWEGDDYLYLNNVSKSYTIDTGEIVTTSNFSYKYPHNLTIGKVVKVSEDPGSHFNKIYVEPATKFFQYTQLFVVNYVPDTNEIELIKEVEDKIKLMERRK